MSHLPTVAVTSFLSMIFIRAFYWILGAALFSRACLAAENAALRQQLACYQRKRGRPRIAAADRLFWVLLKQLWSGWTSSLVMVQPDTVCRWHRQGFRSFCRWKSRRQGRPLIDAELRKLIRRMSRENPLWGAPRIRAELRLLGYEIAESTVARYMARRPVNPSPSWKTFLDKHARLSVAEPVRRAAGRLGATGVFGPLDHLGGGSPASRAQGILRLLQRSSPASRSGWRHAAWSRA